MKLSPARPAAAQASYRPFRRRGAVWLDICLTLAMLGIMAGLAWMGWKRSQLAGNSKASPSPAQHNPAATAAPPP